MFTVIWTPQFTRRARRFLRARPELRSRFDNVLRDLEADPFQPHLRLHALQGELDGYHAISLTYAYSIFLTLRIGVSEIELINIGTHDDVYR